MSAEGASFAGPIGRRFESAAIVLAGPSAADLMVFAAAKTTRCLVLDR